MGVGNTWINTMNYEQLIARLQICQGTIFEEQEVMRSIIQRLAQTGTDEEDEDDKEGPL